MERSFRASILGLGCSDMVSIRQHVSDALADGGTVNWVPANQDDIDFLIINSSFISSSSIQGLLRKGAPVLLVNRAHAGADLEENVLSLPLAENSRLKIWMHEYVLGKKRTATSQMILQNSDLNRVSIENAQQFKSLINKTNGLIHLSDSRGAIGVVDTARELICLVPGRRITVDMVSEIKYEPIQQMPRLQPPTQLFHWMWEVLWSTPSSATMISMEQPVRLNMWPQPSRSADRKDVLRMSAWMSKGVANAQTLAAQSQVPLHRAQHFLSTLVAMGFGETVNVAVAPPPPPNPVSEQPKPEQSGIRRLLSGLRSRLGL